MMKTYDGTEVDVVGQIEINGKPMLIIDPGAGRYVAGVMARYLLCNPSIFKRDIPDLVEIVQCNDENQ